MKTTALMIPAVALTLAACSATAGAGSAGPANPAAVPYAAGQAGNAAAGQAGNDADVRFSQEMIPHHWQAIQIAALASDRGSDPYVRKLAREITENEAADIRVMSGWLRSWGKPVPSGDLGSGHDMPGMISQTQILALEGRSGADFDRLWLTVLAKHLDSGIAMAEKVLGAGTHPGTRDLAKKIVTTQRAEIAQITDRLG
ncbi:hypothetical protein Pth03_62940 [Planotetraspora thailandica]|uniref:DUF305 domain-containing protein n=1 Tax=Planotetraspora thailandica TaxID=487172 RepID=A0A8J3XYT8_9ACTN|nr:DUF305 domain-containing protein [Planotetraspora thailandica]GII57905.1 hypothetical protein Pth03_62940 [Planotetraspora thailandica]